MYQSGLYKTFKAFLSAQRTHLPLTSHPGIQNIRSRIPTQKNIAAAAKTEIVLEAKTFSSLNEIPKKPVLGLESPTYPP